jgi:hypothetical protein
MKSFPRVRRATFREAVLNILNGKTDWWLVSVPKEILGFGKVKRITKESKWKNGKYYWIEDAGIHDEIGAVEIGCYSSYNNCFYLIRHEEAFPERFFIVHGEVSTDIKPIN